MNAEILFSLYEAYREYNAYAVMNHTLEISDEGWVRLRDEDGCEYNYPDAEFAIEVLRAVTKAIIQEDYQDEEE